MLKRVPGVAAVLSANPYYNKPTQEGQFQHFLALAREVDPLPVCVYNVPGRTAANLEPETVARLAAAARNIQAIKEASGKLTQFAELAHIMPRGFKIFSGDDNLALAAIAVGAHGLISVASNEAPAEVARMIRAALEQSTGTRRATWSGAFRGSSKPISGSRIPAPVKTVLSLMGRCGDQCGCRWCLPRRPRAQAGAAGRRIGPAEARADSRGCAVGSFLKETMRRKSVLKIGAARCALLALAVSMLSVASAKSQSQATAAQTQTNAIAVTDRSVESEAEYFGTAEWRLYRAASDGFCRSHGVRFAL